VRSVDIGRARVQIALVRRGKLDAPAPRSVAEHDLVSEVYVVLSGSGTNGTDLRNAATQELKAGDVLVIPAGTGHQFTKIDGEITYLMVRVDPDKVVPLMDAEASRKYLEQNRR